VLGAAATLGTAVPPLHPLELETEVRPGVRASFAHALAAAGDSPARVPSSGWREKERHAATDEEAKGQPTGKHGQFVRFGSLHGRYSAS